MSSIAAITMLFEVQKPMKFYGNVQYLFTMLTVQLIYTLFLFV